MRLAARWDSWGSISNVGCCLDCMKVMLLLAVCSSISAVEAACRRGLVWWISVGLSGVFGIGGSRRIAGER